MSLRPEQVKTQEYLRARGTLLSAAEVRERVAAAFAALEGFLDGVGEGEARLRALPGEWTIQEVVDHLIETHRPSIAELRDLLAGRRPADGPIPASLQSSDPMGRPWPAQLGELRRLQAEVVEILAAAPDRLTDARAPAILVVKVPGPDGRETELHWVEELDWKAYAVIFRLHALDHLNQAKKTLKAARAPR